MKAGSAVPERVKAAFIQGVEARGYEDVTISDICDEAGISRKTFYTYFEDKQAVLRAIIDDDCIKPNQQLYPLFKGKNPDVSSLLLTQALYEGILTHAEFYKRLVGRTHARIFINTFQDAVFDMSMALFGPPPKGEEDRFRYAMRFGASSQAGIIVEWIRDNMKIPVAQLAEWTTEWMNATSVTIGTIKQTS